MKKLLEIKNLKIEFSANQDTIYALRYIDLDLLENEIISIVGESGSGKTILSHSIMKLIDPPGKITNGQILFENEDLITKTEKEMRSIRGKKISLIFQDPFSSLNPTMKLGKQILEIFPKKTKKEKIYDLLRSVGIRDPETRYNQYPHEISGGMRQRVMIAMAIALRPKIIIADEPTTSLDVTIQDQIIQLLHNINKSHKSSIIFISHDISLVSQISNKIYVMYAGKILESGNTNNILQQPKHPYTRLLLDAIPRMDIQKKISYIEGMVLKENENNKGCVFYNRCPYKMNICKNSFPEKIISKDHTVYCHLYSQKTNLNKLKQCLEKQKYYQLKT